MTEEVTVRTNINETKYSFWLEGIPKIIQSDAFGAAATMLSTIHLRYYRPLSQARIAKYMGPKFSYRTLWAQR